MNREDLIREIDFRRGYAHGWLFALEAIRSGFSADDCEKFFEKELIPWRQNFKEKIWKKRSPDEQPFHDCSDRYYGAPRLQKK